LGRDRIVPDIAVALALQEELKRAGAMA